VGSGDLFAVAVVEMRMWVGKKIESAERKCSVVGRKGKAVIIGAHLELLASCNGGEDTGFLLASGELASSFTPFSVTSNYG